MSLILKKALADLVKHGSLEVVSADDVRLLFGDGIGKRVAMRFMDRAAERAFAFDAELKFGELFTDGRLVMEEGTVFDALDLILREARNTRPTFLVRFFDWMRLATRKLKQRNIAQRAQDNVTHHYQLDEKLYALFLDEDWQYSCAYYENPETTLEEAQLAKKRHIAAKLMLDGEQRVLDIGCGWGGLALYLAEFAGASHVTGISLSENQIATAQRRAVERRLSDRVNFTVQDYRARAGTFDRIVSVGMFEHVGLGYYDAFFQACHDKLNNDGVMLLHTIGNVEEPSHTNPWMTKYIFPGGHIPALSEILPAIERSGLIVTDIEILQLHYARTLSEWRRRFMARRSEADVLYGERFCRMWEFYLSAAETAFLWEGVAVFQIQLAHRFGIVPLTRDYIKVAENELSNLVITGRR